MRRRALLRAALASPLLCRAATGRAEVAYPGVVPRPLVFPRDHGSHPAFRTEWWYITGWVRDAGRADSPELGVQVTLFRHRPGLAEDATSRFAPKELLFAHAAIADPAHGRLRHDQRVARAGFGLAEAAEQDTDVTLGDWSLRRAGEDYVARVIARDFTLALAFAPRTPLLLQGDAGMSRKGPRPSQASYYYSRPGLAVTGAVGVQGRERAVEGVAWLDHEWSSEYLASEARGWDWTGINFDDGGALMAFVIRDHGGRVYWAGGTRRDAAGGITRLRPEDVQFTPQRTWRSPRTGATYPVALRIAAGAETIDLAPLMDDQELDSRASVGTIYWEGAVRALRDGRPVGRGYLELTGYAGALRI